LPCEGRVESKGAAEPRDLSGRKGFVDIPRVFLLVLSDYDSKSLACHSFVTCYSAKTLRKKGNNFLADEGSRRRFTVSGRIQQIKRGDVR
jgi:hypothetical protein